MHQHQIPFIGKVYSKDTTHLWIEECTQFLLMESPSYYQRFAVQIGDNGLSGLNIHKGDFLIFRRQDWPDNEEQIVFLRFGDECAVRILEGIWDESPILKVTEEKYDPWIYSRNQYIILGVLVGVLKPDDAKIISIYD